MPLGFKVGGVARRKCWRARRLLISTWIRTLAALLLWGGMSLLSSAVAAPEALIGEYRLKAAFLYRITQFVEWPDPLPGSEDAAFTLCVLGSDPFGESLRELTTRKVGHRRIALLYPSSVKDARVCQMVYLDEVTPKTVAELKSTLGELPILTVGGAPQFIDQGGAVGFVIEAGKLRMEINLDSVRRANLKPSAKLVEVAVRTLGAGRGRP
ncbi:YfiR family protein [Roseateles sp.]|uniref:YfiR family protein n=1 Tax=Roseateles sp. TaxID=1971397 RepID=UPI003BA5AAD7